MAHRIDHTRAMIPPPSQALLIRMAGEGYKVASEVSGRESTTPFGSLPAEVVDTWVTIAKTMYGVIAVEGGAGRIKLAEH
jgi:hypothetical protein